jgi:hypothetical protein
MIRWRRRPLELTPLGKAELIALAEREAAGGERRSGEPPRPPKPPPPPFVWKH